MEMSNHLGILAKRDRSISPDRGDDPPRKISRASTPTPREKNGLFILHDRETAAAEWVFAEFLASLSF
jgi:hypothetical protein